jgi:hypothetical protein
MGMALFQAAADNLRNPRLQSRNKGWLECVQNLKEHYPKIESDLASTIKSLDEIRVFILSADETLHEEVTQY